MEGRWRSRPSDREQYRTQRRSRGAQERRERRHRLRSQGPAGASSQTSRAAGSAAAGKAAAVAIAIRRQGSHCRGPSRSACADRPRQTSGPSQRWFRRQPIVRFFSASLLRRILVSNLMGFFILLGGILYLGWFHTWLIDAKLDALKTQGEDHRRRHRAPTPTVVRERIVSTPTSCPTRPDSPQPFPDDGLAALELSIHPEDVTPILRKLIQPTNTRARIYARDGTLIVDTAQLAGAVDSAPPRACATKRRAPRRRTSGHG